MIDIDRLDQQLELALSPELRAQLKPIPRPAVRYPAPEPQAPAAAVPVAVERPEPHPTATSPTSARPAAFAAAAPERRTPAPPPRPATPPRQVAAVPAAPAPRAHRRKSLRPDFSLHAEPAVSPAPPAPEGSLSDHARQIVELLTRGQLAEADRHIALHASLAEELGTVEDQRDAASWVGMRALLDGRQADARAAAKSVRTLDGDAGDGSADLRYWTQQFWIVLQWGNEQERYDLLDYCRERAYRQNDLAWRSALTLLLARMGRTEEAEREFDTTAEAGLKLRPADPAFLDITTNLAEAAALLGSARRATAVNRAVAWPATGLVMIGRAEVCKGSFARFRALLAAAADRWPEADAEFRTAVEAHRRVGAEPLLARTLDEWGLSLSGRNDPRAYGCLEESSELARRLQLVELLPEE